MTNRELKHLSRGDLLEMLLELSRENEKLEEEVKTLRLRLEDRSVALDNCGSLAEAVLVLNGVFEAAEAACKQYTDNLISRNESLEQRCAEKEEACARRCGEMLAEARRQAEDTVRAAEEEARRRIEEAHAKISAQKDTYFWLSEIMGEGDGV